MNTLAVDFTNNQIFSLKENLFRVEEDFNHSSNPRFIYKINNNKQLLTLNDATTSDFSSICIELRTSWLERAVGCDDIAHERLIINLNPELLNSIYSSFEPPFLKETQKFNRLKMTGAIDKLIESFFHSMIDLLKNRFYFNEDFYALKVREILYLLTKVNNAHAFIFSLNKLYKERTFEFKKTIEKYLFEVNSLEEMASLTNTSLSTFKRKFRNIYRTTPHRYIMDMRLKKVAILLKTTDDTVGTIAIECGFIAPAHLTRAFKAKFDKTPSEYRLEYSN